MRELIKRKLSFAREIRSYLERQVVDDIELYQIWSRNVRGIIEIGYKTDLSIRLSEGYDYGFEESVKIYFDQHAGKKITQINETTRRDIQEALRDDKPIKVDSLFRARLIAQTETHGAVNYGRFKKIERVGLETGAKQFKKWLPHRDGFTREPHASMSDSKPIPYNEPFVVGGEMLMYPGDPSGSAKNIIRCRCTMLTGSERIL